MLWSLPHVGWLLDAHPAALPSPCPIEEGENKMGKVMGHNKKQLLAKQM